MIIINVCTDLHLLLSAKSLFSFLVFDKNYKNYLGELNVMLVILKSNV